MRRRIAAGKTVCKGSLMYQLNLEGKVVLVTEAAAAWDGPW